MAMSVPMPRLELFPFRYRNPITGKWVRARYVAEPHVIAERFPEFEIIGPPEIREVNLDERYFSPHGKSMNAEPQRIGEAPLEPQPPALDALEAFLVRLFLRRYVTYCARRRRFAAMDRAAQLYTEVRGQVDHFLSNLEPVLTIAGWARPRRVAIAGVAV